MADPAGHLSVPNWEEYQHYKDRSPPWIKLHTKLLESYDFACLQDASKAHLLAIWLLASRLDNRIPADAEWVADKISATEPVDLQELVSLGFLETYGDVLAERLQDASTRARPRTPGETEAERETEAESAPAKPRKKQRRRALPDDWEPHDNHRAKALELKVDAEDEAEAFRGHYRAQGGLMADWDQAFYNWLRKTQVYGPNSKNGAAKPKRAGVITERIQPPTY